MLCRLQAYVATAVKMHRDLGFHFPLRRHHFGSGQKVQNSNGTLVYDRTDTFINLCQDFTLTSPTQTICSFYVKVHPVKFDVVSTCIPQTYMRASQTLC